MLVICIISIQVNSSFYVSLIFGAGRIVCKIGSAYLSICLSVYLPIHPFVHLSMLFLGFGLLVFCKFWHGVMKLKLSHLKLCLLEPVFLQKKNLLPKRAKCTKNGPKSWFFKIIQKFGH